MPSYEYECSACSHRFEAVQTIDEHDRHVDHERREPLKCPHCGCQQVEQLVGSSVFVITSKKS
jgi:putative FmdB family regulatory protein